MSGTVLGETVYEVILQAASASQAILNVFYYRVTAVSTTPSALDLATDFDTDVVAVMAANLSDVTQFQLIKVRRLDNITDFAELDIARTGAITTESMPIFVTCPIKLTREDKSTRNGRKAVGVLAEAQVQDNAFTGSGATDMNAIANAFGDDIVTTAATYSPCIVGNKKEANGDLKPEQDWTWNDIVSTAVPVRVSTQNSRKIRVRV